MKWPFWAWAAARRLTAVLRGLAWGLEVVVLAVVAAVSANGRRRRRVVRMQRRAARKVGAYEGHLLAAEAGGGVFGEGPHWRVITTLRPGCAAEVGRAQVQRVLGAGYQLAGAQPGAGQFRFPGTPSLPELSLTVIPQRLQLSDDGRRYFTYPQRPPTFHRRGASPARQVFVWGPAGGTGAPGTAVRHGGGKIRYSRLTSPVVPAEATAVRIHLGEPVPRRETTVSASGS
jgi:hypothetical protein